MMKLKQFLKCLHLELMQVCESIMSLEIHHNSLKNETVFCAIFIQVPSPGHLSYNMYMYLNEFVEHNNTEFDDVHETVAHCSKLLEI